MRDYIVDTDGKRYTFGLFETSSKMTIYELIFRCIADLQERAGVGKEQSDAEREGFIRTYAGWVRSLHREEPKPEPSCYHCRKPVGENQPKKWKDGRLYHWDCFGDNVEPSIPVSKLKTLLEDINKTKYYGPGAVEKSKLISLVSILKMYIEHAEYEEAEKRGR